MISVAHFLVDFSCALLAAQVVKGDAIGLLLLYNFCAFALELPLGVWLEGRIPPMKMATLGMGFVVVSWACFPLPWVALLVAGTGNALFHLGGSLAILGKTKAMTPLGIFIAPGAFGIYFGAFLPVLWMVPTAISLVLLGIYMRKSRCVVRRDRALLCPKGLQIEDATVRAEQSPAPTVMKLAVLALFLLVVLRGFAGNVQVFPWKAQWSGMFILVVALGKALGGILADRFGAYRVGVLSLAVAAVGFSVPNSVALGLLGMLMFQMTMPITLRLLANRLPHGLAFGLLTFGLFLGSLPALLHVEFAVSVPGLILVSLCLFWLGVRKSV